MKHSNISIFIPHAGCPNMCSFCNQRVISGHVSCPTASEVDDICKKARTELGDRVKKSEIAFFGGSFTAIARDYMISLLEVAKKHLGDDSFCGIRVSTRPDCIDREILDILEEYGVTSIELGAQSMCDEVLLANKRGHTADDVRRAATLISGYGFSLGLQMMTHLYKDTDERAIYTAREFVSLHPDTVRIYPTVILKNTPLADLFLSGEYKVPPLDSAINLICKLMRIFKNNSIKIIKLGLHASEDVRREMVGGIYHPALRELCESRIMFNSVCEMLRDTGAKKIAIRVNPRDISKMNGQNKENILKLSSLGVTSKVVGDERITLGTFKIISERQENRCV